MTAAETESHSARRSQPGEYWPFVDGLRAVSIALVVAFHGAISGFSGGFVGVDVFFVISGFLIIGQIDALLEAGRFSLIGFYARRTLRILPPYLAMLAVVAVLAPLVLFSPKEYESFAKAAVAAPLMVSNILFFLEQGYFDPAAEVKPLIHTWTLAVEEQFYLLVPLAAWLVFRLGSGRFGRIGAAIAVTAGVMSFAAGLFWTSTGERNPAFYLMHLRAWEFIAGGLIAPAAAVSGRRLPGPAFDIAAATGLALILAAATLFDPLDPYPSWRAGVPTAGAFLLILGGLVRPRSIVARLLSHGASVHVGKISYSWYLWHWPALSLATIADVGPPSWRGPLFAGAAGFVLAELTWRFIERPLVTWRKQRRSTQQDRKIVIVGFGALLVLSAIGGGAAWIGNTRNDAWLAKRHGIMGRGVIDGECRIVTETELPSRCLTGDYGVLVGDSHADALSESFAFQFDRRGARLVTLARGGCNPAWFTPEHRAANRTHRCANILGPLESVLAAPTPPRFAIVTASYAPGYNLTSGDLAALAGMFPETTRILFIGPVPRFDERAIDCVVMADRRDTSREACGIDRAENDRRNAPVLDLLSSVPAPARAAAIDDIFCDAARCRPWSGETLLFSDNAHLFPAGAERVFFGLQSDMDWLLGR